MMFVGGGKGKKLRGIREKVKESEVMQYLSVVTRGNERR